MQSNAFERSVKSEPNSLPLSTAPLSFLSSSSLKDNLEHYIHTGNPHWLEDNLVSKCR